MDDQQVRPESGPTGDAAVDAQLEALDGLDALPIEEHQAVYSALHDGLRHVLDEGPPEP